ncbi:Acyl carrier protein [bioreactor metagenome]|uniref:Acyl carrier protein n=1 Tax=bioreactor metagenome TaxID=1076179 RepID=A0A645CEB7_9ZZZZ|nr:acyl carrier protein [Oscillospiraceae bacterium]
MFEELKAILTDELDVSPEIITPDAEFIDDLKLNSLELADLVVLCEDKFEIDIDEQDIHTLITVSDLVDYIESKTA